MPITVTQGLWAELPQAALPESQQGPAGLPSAPVAASSVRMLSLAAQGDLTGDGKDEWVALFDANADQESRLYLVVLQREGEGYHQKAAALIGAGVAVSGLEVKEGRVVAEIERPASDSALCCPAAAERRAYALENGALRLVDSEVLRTAQFPSPPSRIRVTPLEFSAGSTTAVVAEEIDARDLHSYGVTVQGGAWLTATVQADRAGAALAIHARSEPLVLLSGREVQTEWSGALPPNQQYQIDIVNLGETTPYTLTVTLAATTDDE